MARDDAPTQDRAAGPLALLSLSLVEALLDTLSDAPFFIKDADLRYVAANSAMLQLCGARSRDELIGWTAERFFSDAARRRYEALDRRVAGHRAHHPRPARSDPGRDEPDHLAAGSRALPVIAPGARWWVWRRYRGGCHRPTVAIRPIAGWRG